MTHPSLNAETETIRRFHEVRAAWGLPIDATVDDLASRAYERGYVDGRLREAELNIVRMRGLRQRIEKIMVAAPRSPGSSGATPGAARASGVVERLRRRWG